MKTTKETSLETLKEVLPLLEAQEDYSNDALYETLAAYVAEKGVKTGFVMWPIRTAVSGKRTAAHGLVFVFGAYGRGKNGAGQGRCPGMLRRAAGAFAL